MVKGFAACWVQGLSYLILPPVDNRLKHISQERYKVLRIMSGYSYPLYITTCSGGIGCGSGRQAQVWGKGAANYRLLVLVVWASGGFCGFSPAQGSSSSETLLGLRQS